MPIRKKVTGLNRGSKGFVYRIPISELGNLSEEEVNRNLIEVYGTDKLKFNGEKLQEYLKKISDDPEYSSGNIQVSYVGEDEKIRGRFGEYPDSNWKNVCLALHKGNNYITLKPAGVRHTITGRIYGRETQKKKRTSPFSDLMSILRTGFKSEQDDTCDGDNILFGITHKPYGAWGRANQDEGITHGDTYGLEFIPEVVKIDRCVSASPKDILGVNIEIDTSSNPKQKEEKMKFYEKEITEKYKIPVRFFEASANKDSQGMPKFKRIYQPQQALEQRVSSVITIAGLASSLFFISSSATGNAIANLSNTTTNFIGVGLFLVAVVAGLFYFKSKHL